MSVHENAIAKFVSQSFLRKLSFLTRKKSDPAERKHMSEWEKNGAPMPAPQDVKVAVLMRHSDPTFPWVETGTFLGTTTKALAKVSPIVISLEPERALYLEALVALAEFQNVEVLNLTSEEGLQSAIDALTEYSGVNFWLDGHFSQGETYRGSYDTPILFELEVISSAIERKALSEARVFIDDVRLFVSEHREEPEDLARTGYPSLDSLVAFASVRGFLWTIEHDVLIMRMA